MQSAKGKADVQGRKAKLANSYQQLLDEFSSSDLKSVGNYTLGRLIGKGSFGKVYLATHKLTNGSKVVLKSAHKDDTNLAREIHHHRQFVHPHIARLYEVIVTENLVWLVLEYCSGDELYNYLLQHGPLRVEKVQKIFCQLVGAVSYVHMQSCVHRDLKLENILLDKNENVKLVDFGFTREYEGRTNYLQTFCGTTCYAAPEMLKGEKYAGEKVDVWSLGIILYALLCGELPFDDDDDSVTRTRILSEEPKYPDHLTPDAVSLLKLLLSKRALPRPSFPDILAHPFLAEHALAQQAILDVKAHSPFATALEKDCLQRMRSAGVDIEAVIESVLAQKCDALAGWWTLLLEKEERKMMRRDRKRQEKELEKGLRRLSAASSRLERMTPVLQNVDEDGGLTGQFVRLGEHGSRRGRSERRSAHYHADFTVTDLPLLPESGRSQDDIPPTPVDKDSIRSASTSRHRRPIPPPKEGVIRSARSRGSTLHLVTTSDTLGVKSNGSVVQNTQQNGQQKTRKKHSQAIIAHWKSLSHWFIENTTKRRKGHERRTSRSTPNLHLKDSSSNSGGKEANPRPQTSMYPTTTSAESSHPTVSLPKGVVANGQPKGGPGNGQASTPTRTTSGSFVLSPAHTRPVRPSVAKSSSYKRQSLSPAPVTPRSAMRRSSAGLRGRKSTSSSVSSIRSMHHHRPSHSKASSTSSAGSVSTSKTPLGRGQSPHHSVKVLPATPIANSFPSNIRLVRGSPVPPPLRIYDEGMPSEHNQQPPPGSPNPFSSGILFAKRKRNIFKGPTLNFGGVGNHSSRNAGSGSHSRSGSATALGRRSGEITIQEEDEEPVVEEEEEDEIEEVESFQPIVGKPGELIEEQILEDEPRQLSAAGS
ncbi:serine/threonine protein kinase [Metarhizium rileyi]|uniref:Serine/threonine protein kinase n=1 Tax=Metarhizium rileyi (strain RCEF 4871) TaxID=1649241 RepID=A0A166WIU9_METRR|nr:serine/threonine protein kinase [Metarhizium rileyi RCEF 4871]